MTTEWEIAELKRDAITDVIVSAVYIMNFTEVNTATGGGTVRDRYVDEVTFSSDPNPSESTGYILFENITEVDVIGWVQDELGDPAVESIESRYQTILDDRIDKINNPEFLTTRPWIIEDDLDGI